MARVLVVDVIGIDGVHEADCEELSDYYRELKCDCFATTFQNVGGKEFLVYCDDNGLFADRPKPSMFTSTLDTILVGNLVFANYNESGDTLSLSDEDIKLIKKNIIDMCEVDGSVFPVVICMTDYV